MPVLDDHLMTITAGRHVAIDGGMPVHTSIDDLETAALQRIANGGTVLEVGSAYGYSSIIMALAGAHVITIDVHAGENPDSLNRLRDAITAYDVNDRVFPIVARSQDILPQLLAGGSEFDLVFIDGDHTTEVAQQDCAYGWALLTPGGCLAVHDYDEPGCPGVREALDGLYPDGPDELAGTLWIKHKAWT